MREERGVSTISSQKNATGAPIGKPGAACGATPLSPVIATTGEMLEDGSMVEPVQHSTRGDQLLLLHWDGAQASVVSRLDLNGRTYQPAALHPTVLRAMSLPAKYESCGSIRESLEEIARVLEVFAALEEPYARIVARFPLATWIVEALPVAPSLRFVGSDTIACSQLLQILGGICRRAIRLTEVTPAGICSLPLEWHPTLLIHQKEVDMRLQRLLDAARGPDEFLPRGKRLLKLHCAIATFTEIGTANGHEFAGVEIPAPPLNRHVKILDAQSLRLVTEKLQRRLMGFRLENFLNARNSTFDMPQFLSRTRDVARSLGACTPGDAELQAELVRFLEPRDAELRAVRWSDPVVTVLESLLGFIHEGKQTSVYVGEIAKAAEAILLGRGEMRKVEAREVGEKLRDLRLRTEVRDARGFKLLLTQEVTRRVHELAGVYAAPSTEVPLEGCPWCKRLAAEEKRVSE